MPYRLAFTLREAVMAPRRPRLGVDLSHFAYRGDSAGLRFLAPARGLCLLPEALAAFYPPSDAPPFPLRPIVGRLSAKSDLLRFHKSLIRIAEGGPLRTHRSSLTARM